MNVTMKIYRITICLSIYLLCLVAGGCVNSSFAQTEPAQPQLRPQLSLNVPYRQQLQMVSDMRLPLGIPNADHKESTMTVECEPIAIDEQGNTTVQVTIASIQASMISLGVQGSYDSDNLPADITELDNRARHFYDVFDGIVNLQYTAIVDQRGAVVELVDLPSKIGRAMEGQIEGSIGEDQLIMLLCRENLKDLVSPSWLTNLENPEVEPNETWQGEQTIVVPRAVPVVGTQTCTLASCETTDDEQVIATITYRTVATDDRPEQSSNNRRTGGGLEIVQAGVVGTTRYSLSQGYAISTNEDMRAEIRTTQSGSRRSGNRNRIYYDVKRSIRWIDIDNEQ